MRLKKKEAKALENAERDFLSYFTLDEDEASPADTLETATESFKEYLLAKGLLKEK